MIKLNKFRKIPKKNNKIGAVIMQKGEIKAVHDKDLQIFLTSLDEYDAVISGGRKCYFCKNTITIDNILSIFPHEGEIHYCCKDSECYKLLIERGFNNA